MPPRWDRRWALPFGEAPLHPTCADCSICDSVSGCQSRVTCRLSGQTSRVRVSWSPPFFRMASSGQAAAKVDCEILLRSSLPTRASQDATVFSISKLAVIVFELAVHENIIHAFGKLRRFGVGCAINDRLRIEDRNIRIEADLDQTSISQMFALCRHRGHFSNGFRKR